MFAVFPKLPAELRQKIWKEALPERRIVHLRQKKLREPKGKWWLRVRSDVEDLDTVEGLEFDIDIKICGEKLGQLGVVEAVETHDQTVETQNTIVESENNIRQSRPEELWGFCTETPTPRLLSLSREARTVALQQYKLVLASFGGFAHIYFDPAIDQLLVDNNTFSGSWREFVEPADMIIEHMLPCDYELLGNLVFEGVYNKGRGFGGDETG